MAVLLGNVNQGLYGGVLMEIPLTRSQTFVPPRNGTVNIICIGAGGSGAYCRNGTGTIGTGGGAGGLCIKEGLHYKRLFHYNHWCRRSKCIRQWKY